MLLRNYYKNTILPHACKSNLSIFNNNRKDLNKCHTFWKTQSLIKTTLKWKKC